MSNGSYRLLHAFRLAFEGTIYKHRISTTGNRIGRELFEDLLRHEVSPLYSEHVRNGACVVSRGGGVHGKLIRRNDSVFGRPPAGVPGMKGASGYRVLEGTVAEPRVGCEVKILAKAQLKQIDRVINDLEGFALRMNKLNKTCINVAVVGVNHEPNYVGFEGAREFRHRLGPGEPAVVMSRLETLRAFYDEVLVLPFRATNQKPFPFAWASTRKVELDYASVLTRLGERYQERFR